MDIEKYSNSKLYIFFEWSFKLIIWNLMTLFIILVVSGLPMYGFYHLQNKYSIGNTEIIDNSIVVTQNNGTITTLGTFIEYGEISFISIDDKSISFEMGSKAITINNTERLKSVDEIFLENNVLFVYGEKQTVEVGNIFDSTIYQDGCSVNINNDVIISLNNGVKINYGKKVETKSTISGVLVIITILLALFAFIPCYVTIFSMIKIYREDGSARTFTLFFNRLWDNFKSLYITELIIVPMIAIMSFALYYYYSIINSLDEPNFFFSFSYNLILICLICVVLFLLNLPMTLGYFRMKTKTILKFTLIMMFKNIIYTLLYLVILAIPILACLLNNFFIPVWFLIGLSLPLYLMYYISRKKYHILVNDFESYKEDDIYKFKGENEE